MGPIEYMSVGLLLEGVAYGAYCVIFCLYLRIQQKRGVQRKNILFYPLTAIFLLCTVYLAADDAHWLLTLRSELKPASPLLWATTEYLNLASDALYTCIDVISQGILIYRCWIMWRRLSVIALPVILSIAFSAIALTALVALLIGPGYGTQNVAVPKWWFSLVTALFSISLSVNALVTGLIVYKIATLYREVQDYNSNHTITYQKGSQYIYPVVSILVESGMITCVLQLVQAILYTVDSDVFPIVGGLTVMCYGISTTIVLVRVDMGINYDNEASRTAYLNSLSLHFAPSESNHDQMVRTLEVVEFGR